MKLETMSVNLTDRIVLVTGASRGLGRAVSLGAAKAGAQVVALARTKAALEELDDEARKDGKQITLLPLDVLNGDAIDRLGPTLLQRFGRLDGFVHCAAELGPLTPTHQIDAGVLANTIAVNAGSAQRLIRSLDPCFRASQGARLVFLCDSEARIGRPFWASYAASKAALSAIVQAYAAETAKTTIEVVVTDPGPMNTRLRREAYPGEANNSHPSPEKAAQQILAALC